MNRREALLAGLGAALTPFVPVAPEPVLHMSFDDWVVGEYNRQRDASYEIVELDITSLDDLCSRYVIVTVNSPGGHSGWLSDLARSVNHAKCT